MSNRGLTPKEQTKTLREELKEKGLIKVPPKLVYWKTLYECTHPAVAKLWNGTILCVFTRAPARSETDPSLSSHGFPIATGMYLTDSTDDGETWSEPTLIDTAQIFDNISSWSMEVIRFTQTVLLAYTIEVGGVHNSYLIKSINGGVTWGAPITIAATGSHELGPDLVNYAGDDFVCVYEKRLAGDLTRAGIFCKQSFDGGDTWGAEITIQPIPIAGAGNDIHAEPQVLREFGYTTDVVCVWHRYYSNGIPEPYWDDAYMSRSTDLGLTWSTPVVFAGNVRAKMGFIQGKPNKDLLLTFRHSGLFNWSAYNPESSSNLALLRSDDGGYTWGGRQILIPNVGGEGEYSGDCYNDLIQLNDGRVLCIFSKMHRLHLGIFLIDVFEETLWQTLARLQGYRGTIEYTSPYKVEGWELTE